MSVRQKNTTVQNTRSRKSIPKPQTAGRKLDSFRETVLDFYQKHGRHSLPWRKTKDPYRILVSEVMLQQTQVDRVIPFYRAFLKAFPSVSALAAAPLAEVLRVWQGLGYNRRAKMLHDAAQAIISEHNGRFPRAYEALVALPGVGGYTTKAVRVFAFNEPETFIETNVRSVFIHHFFPRSRSVSDTKLLPLIEASVQHPGVEQKKGGGAREWYAALMDYGAYLKKTYPNPSRKSAHHAKQKPFKGSNREIRGAIVRASLQGEDVYGVPFAKSRIKQQYAALRREGLIP